MVPCKLNFPMALVLGSLTPHRSVLMSLIVAASIRPVTGILPKLCSFLIEARNTSEFGFVAPPLLSLSSAR